MKESIRMRRIPSESRSENASHWKHSIITERMDRNR